MSLSSQHRSILAHIDVSWRHFTQHGSIHARKTSPLPIRAHHRPRREREPYQRGERSARRFTQHGSMHVHGDRSGNRAKGVRGARDCVTGDRSGNRVEWARGALGALPSTGPSTFAQTSLSANTGPSPSAPEREPYQRAERSTRRFTQHGSIHVRGNRSGIRAKGVRGARLRLKIREGEPVLGSSAKPCASASTDRRAAALSKEGPRCAWRLALDQHAFIPIVVVGVEVAPLRARATTTPMSLVGVHSCRVAGRWN
jgi:hypothetical protein